MARERAHGGASYSGHPRDDRLERTVEGELAARHFGERERRDERLRDARHAKRTRDLQPRRAGRDEDGRARRDVHGDERVGAPSWRVSHRRLDARSFRCARIGVHDRARFGRHGGSDRRGVMARAGDDGEREREHEEQDELRAHVFAPLTQGHTGARPGVPKPVPTGVVETQ